MPSNLMLSNTISENNKYILYTNFWRTFIEMRHTTKTTTLYAPTSFIYIGWNHLYDKKNKVYIMNDINKLMSCCCPRDIFGRQKSGTRKNWQPSHKTLDLTVSVLYIFGSTLRLHLNTKKKDSNIVFFNIHFREQTVYNSFCC